MCFQTRHLIRFTRLVVLSPRGRRILKKIAEGKDDDLGDTSTLAEPSVVEALIEERPAKKSEDSG